MTGDPRGDRSVGRFALVTRHIGTGVALPDGLIDGIVEDNDVGLVLAVARTAGSHEGAVALWVPAGLDAGVRARHRLAAARSEALLDRLLAAIIDASTRGR